MSHLFEWSMLVSVSALICNNILILLTERILNKRINRLEIRCDIYINYLCELKKRVIELERAGKENDK